MLQSSIEPWGNVTKALLKRLLRIYLLATTGTGKYYNKSFIIHFVVLGLKKNYIREWERGKEHVKIRCTCITESDRSFSCGKKALIHIPHSKSSCLQY